MPITFSGTYTAPVVLSNPTTQNPATVTSTGLIDVSASYTSGLSGIAGTAWTVTNNGTVRSTGQNGVGIQLLKGTITNTALISSTRDGILSVGANPNLTIINTGTIRATDTLFAGGIVISSGSIENFGTVTGSIDTSNTFTAAFARADGIQIGTGQITNRAAGLIEGENNAGISTGVYAVNHQVTILNAGTIRSNGTASGVGISLRPEDIGSISNSGLITAISFGVNAFGASGAEATIVNTGTIQATGATYGAGIVIGFGSINNSGLIGGVSNGVRQNNGTNGSPLTVVNSGTIRGNGTTSGVGINISSGSINNSGLIRGAIHGVVSFGTSNTPSTVVNSGTVQATGTGSAGIFLESGGAVSNTATGRISGAFGVGFANAPGTLTNAGTITSTGTHTNAINISSGSINNTGLISGVGNGVQQDLGTAGLLLTVVNSGTVQSSDSAAGTGIQVRSGSINNTGLISGTGGGAGVAALGTSGSGPTIVNSGTIRGTGTASAGTGVYFRSGGVLTNQAGGSITAQQSRAIVVGGTTAGSAAPVTITNSGTITGDTGIVIGSTDTAVNTIDNFGTIAGTGGVAIDLAGGTDRVVIEKNSKLNGTVRHFSPGDSFDLPFLTYASGGTAR